MRVVVFVLGAVVVAATIGGAIRTVILPRALPSRITRWVFVGTRLVLQVWIGRRASFERRDRVMAIYAPFALLGTLLAWLLFVFAGFGAMLWAVEDLSVRGAVALSGASITTLGTGAATTFGGELLTFAEAIAGLLLLALLITYLPSIYTAFSRREIEVSALEVRAGSPPTGVEMLGRFWILQRIDALDEVWRAWETWFADVEETHTSFPALVFFRSPQADHSWITAAGAVLDGASLATAALDVPRDVQREFCIRAGYLCLRRIADFFAIPYDPRPNPDDPISITREEFDEACAQLEEMGVPLKADRAQAWRDFAGWRVNYDRVLLAIAGLVVAPQAPWTSDRADVRPHRPPLLRMRSR